MATVTFRKQELASWGDLCSFFIPNHSALSAAEIFSSLKAGNPPLTYSVKDFFVARFTLDVHADCQVIVMRVVLTNLPSNFFSAALTYWFL